MKTRSWLLVILGVVLVIWAYPFIVARVSFDSKITISDLLTFLALIAGPIIAVQLTEFLRRRETVRTQQVRIFRTLMATRTAPQVMPHVEALNVLDIDFRPSVTREAKVIERRRIYALHLNDKSYQADAWERKREELLSELLFEISECLGYNYKLSEIKANGYWPERYRQADADQLETQRLWLEILRDKHKLPMKAEVTVVPPPPAPESAPPATATPPTP